MKKNIFFIILGTLIFSGCVYYNTFFNAKKYFAEAQEIGLKENGKPTSNAINNYNKAIKKCGVVLSDYKDSKYADDALFLMARSLFYIGRNYTQAIEKFEDLIKFYPESEFAADAKIYIARAKYEFGKKQEAYDLLQEFLLEKECEDHHPKALEVMANFQLKNQDYIEAEYYLAKIIENYPEYDEYERIFFLLGKTKNESGNYKESNEVFTSLLKSRVSKKVKLDSRYFIAYNYLLQKDYKQSKKFINKLLKDEYRESNISKIQLLKARILTGLEETDKAIPIFETVINDNKRTMLSAEASFYLAELYFNQLKDYTKAIEYYNNVKKENSNSDFVTRSVKKSAIASQIIQYYNPDATITTETLVLQQLKLAEYYIESLNMPDSAIIVYDKIVGQKKDLIAKLDSLNLQMSNMNSILDSLLTQDSLLVQTMQDSL
ncbi:MAG: tetratricopeptide repeat protein, partial [Candidatus Cloacimonetes bacterium]|nr:tetratricopeptide repeat protein [Candidatus Cloacimonadota bacterium]